MEEPSVASDLSLSKVSMVDSDGRWGSRIQPGCLELAATEVWADAITSGLHTEWSRAEVFCFGPRLCAGTAASAAVCGDMARSARDFLHSRRDAAAGAANSGVEADDCWAGYACGRGHAIFWAEVSSTR